MRISDWSSDVCSSDLTGQADAAILATALDSVFRIDADSPAAVYGGETALRPGLLLMRGYFRNETRDELLPRLALAVLQLERQIGRAACRERSGQYGLVSLVRRTIKKKKIKNST